MWLLDMTAEKVYCKYDEESKQRHLEESRLNWTMRGSWGGKGRGEGNRNQEQWSRDQEDGSQNGWVVQGREAGGRAQESLE